MSTVGINFGSATSGAGFDVAATVTSILAVSSSIETPWKTQLTALQAQDTAFSSLGTSLSALSTSLGALTNFDGVFSLKQGSSSNTAVLSLTSAGTTALAGSHTVTVTSLATTSSDYSSSLTNPSDVLSGTLSISVGASGSPSLSIPIGSTNNTLSTLAAFINNGAYGVSANVVSDSNGSRLSLVSNQSGALGQITLGGSVSAATSSTTSAPIAFTQGQGGADASLEVDGLQTSSASNTVTTAIPGVTFQLLADAPSTSVQVQIANDNTSIETAAQTFVTSFNAVVTAANTQEGKNSAGVANPLSGDPTLSLLQTQFSTGLLGGAISGAISNIQQLGITVNDDGTLSLDVPTLDDALNSNFSDVTGFLQNAGSFGQDLTATLNSLGSTGKGALSLALAQNASVETSLNSNVTNEDAAIAAQKITLTTELNTANQILQGIPQQLNEVNEIYSAVTGYNQQA